jgi:hypothetical protein
MTALECLVPQGVRLITAGCSVSGCNSPVKTNGMCNKHYQRVWATGSASTSRAYVRGVSLQQRIEFHSRRVESGCIEWTGTKNPKGYGQLTIDGKRQLAHRVAFELKCGQIPAGMCALHRCDNPWCINPNHLFLGTKAENNADMRAKGRHSRGVHHPGAKLTDAEVEQIRKSTGNQRLVAERFGIVQSYVSMIRNGKKRP